MSGGISPVMNLSHVIGRIRTEEAKEDLSQICDELGTVSASLAKSGDTDRARAVQLQIMRLRTLESRL